MKTDRSSRTNLIEPKTSSTSTRATKEDIKNLIEVIKPRLARATEKDVYILEEVEETLKGLITLLEEKHPEPSLLDYMEQGRLL